LTSIGRRIGLLEGEGVRPSSVASKICQLFTEWTPFWLGQIG
jgi:hypothetical protein